METNVEKAISDFVEEPQVEEEETKTDEAKEVTLNEREGLIERVDKIFVTQDGKQLLREQY